MGVWHLLKSSLTITPTCSRTPDSFVCLPVHMELAESGIAVFGMDAHGHGRSEPHEAGDRALVHDFRHLVSVLAVLRC